MLNDDLARYHEVMDEAWRAWQDEFPKLERSSYPVSPAFLTGCDAYTNNELRYPDAIIGVDFVKRHLRRGKT